MARGQKTRLQPTYMHKIQRGMKGLKKHTHRFKAKAPVSIKRPHKTVQHLTTKRGY